jgi:hypothetical protein
MLQIKVFQGGWIRIYNTNSFKEGEGMKSELHNFLVAITNVDLGDRKNIGFVDVVTGTNVFVSPTTCLIEVEEVAEE